MKDINQVHKHIADLYHIDLGELFVCNTPKYEQPMRLLLLIMNEYYKMSFDEMLYNYAYARVVNLPTFIYDARLMLRTNKSFSMAYNQVANSITRE